MAEETTNVEETVQAAVEQQVQEQKAVEPAIVETKDDDTNITTGEDGTIKIDLRKQPKQKADAVQKSSAESSVLEPIQQGEEAGENPTVEVSDEGRLFLSYQRCVPAGNL